MKISEITDRSEWEEFVLSDPDSNFLQSWQWGEFQESLGKTIIRRGIYDGDNLVGVYTGQVESARLGQFLAIAGGPILDWENNDAVRSLFFDMRQKGKDLGCVFVRVRPQREKSERSLSDLKSLGLRKSPMYLSVEHAGVLDLTKTEEEITKGMRQRLRRSLRKAAKADIEIETSTDPEIVEKFFEVQLSLAGRHGFVPFTKEFLKKQFAAFSATNSVIMYTARHNGEILAQNFMIFYGQEASYHYGVSTELGTRLSSAPLLHMEAMREARKRGCSRYNFWGIVDEDETNHRFYGVSQFKRGFGVDDLYYTPAHDIVIKRYRYMPAFMVETLRRKYRKV